MPDAVEPTMVTMRFDGVDPERLVAALARYVVLSRGHPGCRNIDLCQSVTEPGRFVVIEKWDSPTSQRAHLDSAEFLQLAAACDGLLRNRPDIELLDGLSAHDLA
ncbi:MAG TPA: antibiotic biosynthesis monooxygenase family protein [Acidimicrobiales bacterium]|nr:antibiotic biosynthesis monooxygenase family protein [Acidimicrobiales bacterium]